MTTRRTPLPGVGVQYDLLTRAGRHIAVVVHDDGRRFIGFYSPDDPDACQATVPLEREEAARLAELMAPGHADGAGLLPTEPGVDLVTERIPVGGDSPYSGRPLGATRARTRTGASIVAVLRRTGAHPSPGPDFRLEAGDTLVAVGTREGVGDLSDLISGG
ncbi:TrkA C-terminal domain-containing protein [Streptomyces calidiresistens]|uniref:Potassium transporter TrkA n=1 Tax=Streptomyces calidiresistens TaxID=1485586 RepID=A0A7W3T556_9ACTN|nr:cation:proton antiporter regulatory subunit [Streptomyces calidiresistens]MBB0231119.1 potassium transporter TrkA [Streptomyces calidiresistens]